MVTFFLNIFATQYGKVQQSSWKQNKDEERKKTQENNNNSMNDGGNINFVHWTPGPWHKLVSRSPHSLNTVKYTHTQLHTAVIAAMAVCVTDGVKQH